VLTSYISAAVVSRLPAAFPVETVPDDTGQGGGGGSTSGEDVLTGASVSYPSWVPIANIVGLLIIAVVIVVAFIGLGMLIAVKKGGSTKGDLETILRIFLWIVVIGAALGGGLWAAAKVTAAWAINSAG
jgi:hypothetical protein